MRLMPHSGHPTRFISWSASQRMSSGRATGTSSFSERDQPTLSFVPQHQTYAAETLQKSEPPDITELGIVTQHIWQPIVGNAAAKMMNVLDANVGTEPPKHRREVVIRGAAQRRFVQVPAAIFAPEGLLELVLHIEQPHTESRSEKHDRQVDKKESFDANEPDQQCRNRHDCRIGCLCADPGLPAAP